MEADLAYYTDCCVFLTQLRNVSVEEIDSKLALLKKLPQMLLSHINTNINPQISEGAKDYQKETGLSDDAMLLTVKFSLRAHVHRTVIELFKTHKEASTIVYIEECIKELINSDFFIRLIDSIINLIGQSTYLSPSVLSKPTPTQLLAAQLVSEDLKHAAIALYYFVTTERSTPQFVMACCRLGYAGEVALGQIHDCVYAFPIVFRNIASNITMAVHIISLTYIAAFVNCTEFPSATAAPQSNVSLYVFDLVPLMSSTATSTTARTAFFWLYCALSSFKSIYPTDALAEVIQTTFNELCIQELEPALRTRKENIKATSLSRTHFSMDNERQTAFGRITSDSAQIFQRQVGTKAYRSVIDFEEKITIVRTYFSRHLMDDSVLSSLLDYTATKPLLHIAEQPAPSFDVFVEFSKVCYHVKHMDDPDTTNPMSNINPSNELEYKEFLLDKLSPIMFTDVVLRLAMAGISLYMETDRTVRFVPPVTLSLGGISESLCTYAHDDFLEALPLLYNTIGSLFGTTFSWMDPIVKQCRIDEANSYYKVISLLMDKCLDYEQSELDALQSAHAQRRSIANVGISRYDRHNLAVANGYLDGAGTGNIAVTGHLSTTIGPSDLPTLSMCCSRLMACVGCMLTVGGDQAFRGLNSDNIITVILKWLFSELDTPGQVLGALSISQGLAYCPAYGAECMNILLRNTDGFLLTKPLVDMINEQKAMHINTYGQEVIGYGGFDFTVLPAKLDSKIFDSVTSYAAPFNIYFLNKFITTIGGVNTFVKDRLIPTLNSIAGSESQASMVRETAFGIQQISAPAYVDLGRVSRKPTHPIDEIAILTADDIICFTEESGYAPQTLNVSRNQLLKTLCLNLTPLTNVPDFDLLVLEQVVRTLSLYNINPEVISQIAFIFLLRLAVTLNIAIDPMTKHPKYNTLLESSTNLRYMRLLEASLNLLVTANTQESTLFLDHLSNTTFGPEVTTICSVLTETTFQTGPLYEAGGFESMEVANVLHALEDMISATIYSSFIGGKCALISLLQSYLSSSLCIPTKARTEYMHRSVCTIAREISMIVIKDLRANNQVYLESNNLLANLRLQSGHNSVRCLFNVILKLFNICLRSSLASTDEDILTGISEVLILDNFAVLAETMVDILLSDQEFLSTVARFICDSVIAALHSQHIYTLVGAQEPIIQAPPESSEQSVIGCLLFLARLLILSKHPTFLIPNITHSIGLLVSCRSSCPYEGDLPGRYSPQDATGRFSNMGRVTTYREQVSVRMGTSSFILLLFCLLDRFCTADLHSATRVLLLELRKTLDLETFTREVESSCSLRETLVRVRHSFLHSPSCAEALLVAISCELPACNNPLLDTAFWVPSMRLLKIFFLGEESRCVSVQKSMLRLDPVTSLYHALRTVLERDSDHLWLYPSLAEHGYNLFSQFLEYTFMGPQASQSQDAMHVLTDLGGDFFTTLFIKTGLIVRRARKLPDLIPDFDKNVVDTKECLNMMEKMASVLFTTASCLRLLTIYLHIVLNSSNIVHDSNVSELVSGLFGAVLGTICYPKFNEDGMDRLIELLPQEDRDKLSLPRVPAKFDSLSRMTVNLLSQAAVDAFFATSSPDYSPLYEIIIDCMQILADIPRAEISDFSRQILLLATANLTGQGLRYSPLISKTKLQTQLLLTPCTMEQRSKILHDSNVINNNACVMEAFTAFMHALNNLQYNTYTNIYDAIHSNTLSHCGMIIPFSALMNNYLQASMIPINCYVYAKDHFFMNLVPEILNEMLFSIQQAAVFIKQKICNDEAVNVCFLNEHCFSWMKLTIRILANISIDNNECSLQHAFSAAASVMQTITHIANVLVDRDIFVANFIEQLLSQLNVQSYFSDSLRTALANIEMHSGKIIDPKITDYVGHAALTMVQSTVELFDILLAFVPETDTTSTFLSELLNRILNQSTLITLFDATLDVGRTLFSSAAHLKTTSLITQSVALIQEVTKKKAYLEQSSMNRTGKAVTNEMNSLMSCTEMDTTTRLSRPYDQLSITGTKNESIYDIAPAGILFLRGLLLLITRLSSWYHDPALIETYLTKLTEEGSGWMELLHLLSFNTLRERLTNGIGSIDEIFHTFFTERPCSLEEIYEIATTKAIIGELLTPSQYEALLSSFVFRIHTLGYAFLSMLTALVAALPERQQKTILTTNATKSLLPTYFYKEIIPNIIANVHLLVSLKVSLKQNMGFSNLNPLPLILSLVLGEIDKSLTIVFTENVHSDEIIRTACNFLCVTSNVIGQAVPPHLSSMNRDISYYPLSMSVFVPAISSAMQCILEYIIYTLSGVTGVTVGIGGAVSSQLLAITREIGNSMIPLIDNILGALVDFSSNDALENNNCLQCIECIKYTLLILLQPEYQLIIDKAYSGDVVTRPNVGYVDISDRLENILAVMTESGTQINGSLIKMIRSILKCQL